MGTNSTLLCIHRDPVQLTLLREHGYELATATNGSDALRLFRSTPVDAVVLEHDLLLNDGMPIVCEIKQTRPDMPIILVVEHMELPARALKSVDAIVAKSDGPHFLLATVYFILNVKPARRQQVNSQPSKHPRRAKRSSVTERKGASFSRRVWRGIHNGDFSF
jgi:DNA-binding response OmpR family regulator